MHDALGQAKFIFPKNILSREIIFSCIQILYLWMLLIISSCIVFYIKSNKSFRFLIHFLVYLKYSLPNNVVSLVLSAKFLIIYNDNDIYIL